MATRPLSELAAHLNQLADSAGVSDTELLRRFAESRDQAAFELLVWRHGGLVLGTCRRVLGRSADADDAFQAAFLALARKAGSVRRGESLPGWLHRVALRAALKLRTTANRRARVESHHLPEDAVACPALLPDDTAAVLDEEIGQLPDKLRVAFVLCHLLGHTHEEAAEQLGCPRGTVLSRVARARERLQARLTRRGVAPVVAGIVCVEQTVLPAALVASTVGASVGFATSAENVLAPARVTALAHALARTTTSSWLKPAAAALVVVTLLAGAVWAARAPTNTEPPPNQPPAPVPPPVPLVGKPVPPVPLPNFKLATADKGLAQVDEVRFSPNGKWIVTAGGKPNGDTIDSAVAVWDAATGKHVHTFTEPDGVGAALAFSPDSKLFATANPGDGTVSLWTAGTWKEKAKLAHPMANDIRFSSDGKLVVTLSCAFSNEVHSEVKVWNTDTGKLAFERAPKRDEAFYSATFSPDGKTLAVGNGLGLVRLLDAKTGKPRAEIQTPERATGTAFSPGGDKLLTWSADAEAKVTVQLWNVATGKEERKLDGNDQPVRYATFSPDGKRVAAVRNAGESKDPAVWLWDVATGKKAASIALSKECASETQYLTFSADGTLLAACGSEQKADGAKLFVESLSVLYAADGKEVVRLPGVRSVEFDPAGKVAALVTGAAQRTGFAQPAPPDDVVTVRGVADLLKQK